MRKLDKNLIAATAYKAWLDKLEADGAIHPAYNSTNKFYKDVVANLLWIQRGVCAYTERFLFDHNDLTPNNWENGRYLKEPFEFYGHLEHYDESLKENKGWLWSNFFVVDADINTKRKGSKPVKYALKPDTDNYDPYHLLEYDFRNHVFLANSERDLELKREITHDIAVLGLNYQSLVQKRRILLTRLIDDIDLNKKTWREARAGLGEYFTAFEMIVKALNLG
jgi:hypothetical protein